MKTCAYRTSLGGILKSQNAGRVATAAHTQFRINLADVLAQLSNALGQQQVVCLPKLCLELIPLWRFALTWWAADHVTQFVKLDEIVGLSAQFVRNHRRLRADA